MEINNDAMEKEDILRALSRSTEKDKANKKRYAYPKRVCNGINVYSRLIPPPIVK